MSTYGGPDFANAFRTVRNNTIKIAEEIPEDKYSFRATPDSRSIAQLLIHIVHAPRFNYHLHAELKATTMEGVDFMSLMTPAMAEEQNPPAKAQILERLRAEGESFANWIAGAPDEFLAQMVASPPQFGQPPKSRFEMLLGVKEHEMHHRGQLMLLQRMVGIVPHLTREREARMAEMMQQAAAKT